MNQLTTQHSLKLGTGSSSKHQALKWEQNIAVDIGFVEALMEAQKLYNIMKSNISGLNGDQLAGVIKDIDKILSKAYGDATILALNHTVNYKSKESFRQCAWGYEQCELITILLKLLLKKIINLDPQTKKRRLAGSKELLNAKEILFPKAKNQGGYYIPPYWGSWGRLYFHNMQQLAVDWDEDALAFMYPQAYLSASDRETRRVAYFAVRDGLLRREPVFSSIWDAYLLDLQKSEALKIAPISLLSLLKKYLAKASPVKVLKPWDEIASAPQQTLPLAEAYDLVLAGMELVSPLYKKIAQRVFKEKRGHIVPDKHKSPFPIFISSTITGPYFSLHYQSRFSDHVTMMVLMSQSIHQLMVPRKNMMLLQQNNQIPEIIGYFFALVSTISHLENLMPEAQKEWLQELLGFYLLRSVKNTAVMDFVAQLQNYRTSGPVDSEILDKVWEQSMLRHGLLQEEASSEGVVAKGVAGWGAISPFQLTLYPEEQPELLALALYQYWINASQRNRLTEALSHILRHHHTMTFQQFIKQLGLPTNQKDRMSIAQTSLENFLTMYQSLR